MAHGFEDECYKMGYQDAIKDVCEWLKKNFTTTHPRTGREVCMVNLNSLKEAMKK